MVSASHDTGPLPDSEQSVAGLDIESTGSVAF